MNTDNHIKVSKYPGGLDATSFVASFGGKKQHEVFEMCIKLRFDTATCFKKSTYMTIYIEKAKQALAALEREKQEQRERLQLAAQAKLEFDKRRSTFLEK